MYAYYESSVGHRHIRPSGLGRQAHMSSLQDGGQRTQHSNRPEGQRKPAQNRSRKSDPTTIGGTDLSVRCIARHGAQPTAGGRLPPWSTFLDCTSGHCDGKSSMHTKNGRVQRLAAGLPEDFKSIRDGSRAACRLLPRSSTAHCIIVPAAN